VLRGEPKCESSGLYGLCQHFVKGLIAMIHRSVAIPIILFLTVATIMASRASSSPVFEVSFPPALHRQPVTGRVLLIISRSELPEVRKQTGWVNSPPVFGLDVTQLKADEIAVVGQGQTRGYPFKSLEDLPTGDYFVQALLNVYSEFHRADGHVIWAHMDRWEGQKFNESPGNLYSRTTKVHFDAKSSDAIKISLTEMIPALRPAADTAWVKHVKIQSDLLTKFWGRPMYLGAIILLPRNYSSDPHKQYPVVYQQGHFTQEAPFGFRTDDVPEPEVDRQWREHAGIETGRQFFQAWSSDHFPRMIAVEFLHPTPYSDDSYAVNSANNGPYGDAIMTELIPYIESHFRIIRQSYARVLTGGSTGGWEALALQLYHPDFFGGAWVLYPDPVDFRRYGLVNIYDNDNAFTFDSPPGPAFLSQGWQSAQRIFERTDEGQPLASVQQLSQLEAVLGSQGRSVGSFASWEAVYGPVGTDGYPVPLWNKSTGKIDHSVADYMRDQGYDLRDYAAKHWSTIGPELVGKLHVSCGDMDNFYLNLSVYLLEDFLKNTKDPYYNGSFEYGRPLKGHGWTPMPNAEIVRSMARYITRNAPKDAPGSWTTD
jgi:hypothetical protein